MDYRPGSSATRILVLLFALGTALCAAAQSAPPPAPEVQALKAELQRLLDAREAQHQKELQELRETVAQLQAQVAALQAAPAAQAQPPQLAGANTAPAPPTPASASPPPAPPAPAASPAAEAVPSMPMPHKAYPPEGTPLSAGIPINVYGSLRFVAATDTEGGRELQDDASRIGFKGTIPLGDSGASVFARAEVGMRLVKSDSRVIFGGDPGHPEGQANGVFSARLGILGVESRLGTFTWGKQYSTYYDIGSWTDQCYAWGGEAQSSFPGGTDGGVSGTGRADQCFRYQSPKRPFTVAVQVQNRNLTGGNVKFADTFGASLAWDVTANFSVGAAYNQVRDGVAAPDSGEPREGDRATIGGVKFSRDGWYAAATYARFFDHDQDDAGTWFSGHGVEFILSRQLKERWQVYGGFNVKEPDGSYAGLYRMRYLDLGVSYSFYRNSYFFLELKPEHSRNADGSDGRRTCLGGGIYFSF